MQTKAELKISLTQAFGGWRKPLSPAERAVDDWAMVDDHQAVLEVFGQQGNLLKHYLNRYSLRACGLCFHQGQIDELRQAIYQAEIMPAAGGDIPWHSGSFDRILMANPLPRYINLSYFLQESLRVLRPGGQLTIALPAWPVNMGSGEGSLGRQALLMQLEATGFVDVSFRRSRLGYASILAKRGDA